MARISGINIPTDKKIWVSLTYIYGIGKKVSFEILEKTKINKDSRTKDLSEDEVAKIRKCIDSDYPVEGDRRREISLNIKRLMDLGCYRGLRHRKGLPVRGQSTHTNARTHKGRRAGVVKRK